MNAPLRQTTMTCAAINALLPTMLPGEALIYHVGSLMHDRVRGLEFGRVHGAAQAAWDAYERGEVTLVQRRIAPLKFEYIAIRRDAARVGK
jgi:hypothetical protein